MIPSEPGSDALTAARAAATPPSASTSPDDRATTFQAVQGGTAHYSGEALLVSAYAVLWTIVLAWVAVAWRKQVVLSARLDDLERVIDEAARKSRSGE